MKFQKGEVAALGDKGVYNQEQKFGIWSKIVPPPPKSAPVGRLRYKLRKITFSKAMGYLM